MGCTTSLPKIVVREQCTQTESDVEPKKMEKVDKNTQTNDDKKHIAPQPKYIESNSTMTTTTLQQLVEMKPRKISFQRYLDQDRIDSIKKELVKDRFLVGSLTFVNYSNDLSIYNIDGQHRLEALLWLYDQNKKYRNLQVTFQVIQIQTDDQAKYYYELVNRNKQVVVPMEYLKVDDVKELTSRIIKEFPACFSDKATQRPFINPNNLLNWLSTNYELVSDKKLQEKYELLMSFNTKIKNTPLSKLKKNKQDKVDIIERAKERAEKKGGLYLGIFPIPIDWNIILDR